MPPLGSYSSSQWFSLLWALVAASVVALFGEADRHALLEESCEDSSASLSPAASVAKGEPNCKAPVTTPSPSRATEATDWLQISYVEVLSASGENLALNKPASSSGAGWGTDAMNPVTGPPGVRSYDQGYHSDSTGGWWMVDLGGEFIVSEVVFYNRGDCCHDRAKTAVVQLLSAHQKVLDSPSLNGDLVQTLVFNQAGPETCLHNVTPYPQNTAGAPRTVEANADGLAYFSYYPDGACHLQAIDLPGLAWQGPRAVL